MKLYYATLANDDALNEIMQHGIHRADSAPVVLLAETEEQAGRVIMAAQEMYDRDVVEMYVYTVEIPDGETLQPISAADFNLAGIVFHGYPGDVPPDWIPSEYTTMKFTAKN